MVRAMAVRFLLIRKSLKDEQSGRLTVRRLLKPWWGLWMMGREVLTRPGRGGVVEVDFSRSILNRPDEGEGLVSFFSPRFPFQIGAVVSLLA
jgi:hypothetical protein